jgi:hypothetical protein
MEDDDEVDAPVGDNSEIDDEDRLLDLLKQSAARSWGL